MGEVESNAGEESGVVCPAVSEQNERAGASPLFFFAQETPHSHSMALRVRG